MEAISHAGTVLAVLSKEGIAMAAEKVSPVARCPHSLSDTSAPCIHETLRCNGLGRHLGEYVADTVAESHWQTARSVACARGVRYGRRGCRGVDGRWWGEDLLAEQVSAWRRDRLHVGPLPTHSNPSETFGLSTISIRSVYITFRPHHDCIYRCSSGMHLRAVHPPFSHLTTHLLPLPLSSRR